MGKVRANKKRMDKKTFHYRFFVRSVIGGGYTYMQAIKGCAEKGWFLAPIFDLRQNEALLRMFRENEKLTEGRFHVFKTSFIEPVIFD